MRFDVQNRFQESPPLGAIRKQWCGSCILSFYSFYPRSALYLLQLDKKLDKYPKENFHKITEEVAGLEKKFHPSKDIINQFMLGQQSDLSHKQPRSINELTIYCYRVAGIVGLMVCDALEVKNSNIRRYAIDLGIAMQLTNISRDIKEDSAMGRVYLPKSLVGRLLADEVNSPNKATYNKIKACQNTLLKLADKYYASADLAIPFLPGRTSLAIKIASKLYQAIGKKIINKDVSS